MAMPSNIESLIVRRFAIVGQTAVSADTGIDHTMLSRFIAGERGLRIGQIGPVLKSLGLALIECDGETVTMPSKRASSLAYLAAEALARIQES